MVSSESRLEYYFALTLHNGSTLDFPAGHAGFLPSGPDETADDKALEKVVLNLESRRHMVEDDEYPFSQALEVPACVRPSSLPRLLAGRTRRLTEATSSPCYAPCRTRAI